MPSTIDWRSAARWWAIRIAALVLIFVGASASSHFLMFGPYHTHPLIAGGGSSVDKDVFDRLHDEYGLSGPWIENYDRWLRDVAHGDFGDSKFSGEPVTHEASSRLAPTLGIMVCAFAFVLAIQTAIGRAAATAAGSSVAILVWAVCAATPAIVLGTIGVTYPQLIWGYESGGGYSDWRAVLPASLAIAATTFPFVKSQPIKNRSFPSIRQAALSAFPVWFPFYVAAAVIIELTFRIDGLGYLFFRASIQLDLYMVQALLVAVTVLGIGLRLIVLGEDDDAPSVRGTSDEDSMWRSPVILGLLVLGALATAAVAVPPTLGDLGDLHRDLRSNSPSWDHWFGTNRFGQDMGAVVLVGVRDLFWVMARVIGIALVITGAVVGLSMLLPRATRPTIPRLAAALTGAPALCWLLMFSFDVQSSEFARIAALGVVTGVLVLGTANPLASRGPAQMRAAASGILLTIVFVGALAATLGAVGALPRYLSDPSLGSSIHAAVTLQDAGRPHVFWFPVAALVLSLFAVSLIASALRFDRPRRSAHAMRQSPEPTPAPTVTH